MTIGTSNPSRIRTLILYSQITFRIFLLLTLDIFRLIEVLILLEEYLICLLGPHIEIEHPLWCVGCAQSVTKCGRVEGIVVFKFDIEKVGDLVLVIGGIQFLWGIKKMQGLSLRFQVDN